MKQDFNDREYKAWQEEDLTEQFHAQPGQVLCPSCGTPNSPGSRFCENCGCSLEGAQEPSMGFPQEPSMDFSQEEFPQEPGRRLSPVIIAVIAVVLLAAGAALWFIMNHDGDDGADLDSGEKETTASEESKDSEDSGQTGGIITDLKEGDVSVVASDWDWDSALYDSSQGMYRVDAILYIKNNLDKPITGIDFAVLDKNWNEVENDYDPEESLFACGYIDAGAKGIMVGQVWSQKNKVRPNDDTYQIEAAYTGEDLEGYTVPYGQVTKKYGPNGDYYDVVLSNPNDIDVDQDAIIVAVKISGNKIKDSDATGTIDRPIPARTDSFTQKKAFNDPNLLTDPDQLEVYAIDVDLLFDD